MSRPLARAAEMATVARQRLPASDEWQRALAGDAVDTAIGSALRLLQAHSASREDMERLRTLESESELAGRGCVELIPDVRRALSARWPRRGLPEPEIGTGVGSALAELAQLCADIEYVVAAVEAQRAASATAAAADSSAAVAVRSPPPPSPPRLRVAADVGVEVRRRLAAEREVNQLVAVVHEKLEGAALLRRTEALIYEVLHSRSVAAQPAPEPAPEPEPEPEQQPEQQSEQQSEQQPELEPEEAADWVSETGRAAGSVSRAHAVYTDSSTSEDEEPPPTSEASLHAAEAAWVDGARAVVVDWPLEIPSGVVAKQPTAKSARRRRKEKKAAAAAAPGTSRRNPLAVRMVNVDEQRREKIKRIAREMNIPEGHKEAPDEGHEADEESQLRELEGLQSLLEGQDSAADGRDSMGLQFGEVPKGAPAADTGRMAGANAAAVAQLRDDGMQRLEDMLVAEERQARADEHAAAALEQKNGKDAGSISGLSREREDEQREGEDEGGSEGGSISEAGSEANELSQLDELQTMLDDGENAAAMPAAPAIGSKIPASRSARRRRNRAAAPQKPDKAPPTVAVVPAESDAASGDGVLKFTTDEPGPIGIRWVPYVSALGGSLLRMQVRRITPGSTASQWISAGLQPGMLLQAVSGASGGIVEIVDAGLGYDQVLGRVKSTVRPLTLVFEQSDPHERGGSISDALSSSKNTQELTSAIAEVLYSAAPAAPTTPQREEVSVRSVSAAEASITAMAERTSVAVAASAEKNTRKPMSRENSEDLEADTSNGLLVDGGGGGGIVHVRLAEAGRLGVTWEQHPDPQRRHCARIKHLQPGGQGERAGLLRSGMVLLRLGGQDCTQMQAYSAVISLIRSSGQRPITLSFMAA